MRERHGINPALHENVGKPTSELTATFGTGIEPVPTTGCTRRSSNRMASAAKLAVPCAGWRSATFSAEASPAMLPRAISSPCVLTGIKQFALVGRGLLCAAERLAKEHLLLGPIQNRRPPVRNRRYVILGYQRTKVLTHSRYVTDLILNTFRVWLPLVDPHTLTVQEAWPEALN